MSKRVSPFDFSKSPRVARKNQGPGNSAAFIKNCCYQCRKTFHRTKKGRQRAAAILFADGRTADLCQACTDARLEK